MSSTVGDAVDRTLNVWLEGTYSGQQNAVLNGIDGASTTTEIPCQFPLTGIAAGSLLAIENELCFIVETDQTNQRVVVVRGARGTLPAAHTAGTIIEVNPRFPRYMVRQMMQADIVAWPKTLFNIQHFSGAAGILDTTVPIPDSINGFKVTRVLNVRRRSLFLNDNRYRRTQGYEVQWDLFDPVVSPIDGSTASGVIALDENWGDDRTFAVRVGCDFNVSALEDDDNSLEDDVGLSGGMREILELGAAYRLLMGRGAVRLFPEAEGQSRMVQEVSGQDIPRLAEMLLQLQGQRIESEADNLYRRSGFGGS